MSICVKWSSRVGGRVPGLQPKTVFQNSQILVLMYSSTVLAFRVPSKLPSSRSLSWSVVGRSNAAEKPDPRNRTTFRFSISPIPTSCDSGARSLNSTAGLALPASRFAAKPRHPTALSEEYTLADRVGEPQEPSPRSLVFRTPGQSARRGGCGQ
jgi:hypothetical protein